MSIIDYNSEIVNFKNIAKYIKPRSGEIPFISGLDIYGETISLTGEICGDHIIYVDFAKRFNLDERIIQAFKANRIDISNKLNLLNNRAGILISDVCGHSITDHLLNAMLHQAFLVGASYELTMNGEITIDLFETINQRFYQSSSIDKFITLLYGEIQSNGDFRFISAGHPQPVIFSNEYNRLVNIDNLNLLSFPPIGTLPSETHIDGKLTHSFLGSKKRYSVNNLSVMGTGDILVLFTDGFTDQKCSDANYIVERLNDQLKRTKYLTSKEILSHIKNDFIDFYSNPDDDATMILIKKL